MTDAIVFSRDRPAQLDLLLRSIRTYARWIGPVTVLYTYSAAHYAEGYRVCMAEHPDMSFVPETDFRAQTLAMLPRDGHAMFLCDDDVVFRSIPDGRRPSQILNSTPEILCVSLRLGLNVTECYSMRAKTPPPQAHGYFQWRGLAGDWGYPGSLDGNVWRAEQLRLLIDQPRAVWASPNELEDALNTACQSALLPIMSAYPLSTVVGVPVNSVQTVYDPNRHAETHRAPLATLNRHFLAGGRLDLSAIRPLEVRAAHCEFRLVWEPKAEAAA